MGAGGSTRWRPVVAYATLSAANQMLWLTFTPFTTDAARHYGVSSGAIGWLAEIFPLVYVVLAVPSGKLIDRHLPRWLACGAVLTAAGGALRLADDAYLALLAGQLLVAVGQPFVLNAVTKLSGSYLRPEQRAAGIAVSSAGIFAGMLVALLSGVVLGAHQVRILLVGQAVLAVLAACWLCTELRRPGEFRPAHAAAVPLRRVWADPPLRLLIALGCLGFGVFIALTTWLQTLLEPAGVSDTAAGYLLLAMVVAGVLGSALLPALVARQQAQLGFLAASIAVGAAGLAVLAAAPGLGSGLPVAIVVGLLLLTDLPILLELTERRAGHAGGAASALIWLAGNAAGLVAALVVQVLRHHPPAAFAVLAGVLLGGAPVLVRLRRSAAGLEPAAPPVASERI